jgi:hypothetical protein
MIAFWAVGFALFGGFVPPPSPRADAAQITDMIRGATNEIRFGLLLTVLGSALLGPFIGVISMHMKRIEGGNTPLAYAQLVLGACLIMEFIFPVMVVQTAAYRPERSPEIVQMLDDLCWIPFFGVTSTAALEAALLGIVILQDRREFPLFPRWSGYYCLWSATLFTPGAVLVFFNSGPFAWDGLFVFWMPVVVFSSWIFVMTWLMIRSTNEGAAASGDTGDYVSQAQFDELVARLATVLAQREQA